MRRKREEKLGKKEKKTKELRRQPVISQREQQTPSADTSCFLQSSPN
jgi:hypothetical protein